MELEDTREGRDVQCFNNSQIFPHETSRKTPLSSSEDEPNFSKPLTYLKYTIESLIYTRKNKTRVLHKTPPK